VINRYPVIDAISHSFKVEIKIPNSKLELRPGMFSRINLVIGSAETILVPSNTILQQEGTNKRFVFINKNNVAKKIYVKIGRRFDDSFEIISNEIKEGDQLVIAGQAVLSNNSKINVIK
ncbi:MAG: efflux transporter periplasmic adaptor subunit, partial [Prolixibacteraceae bacterium]|nr:efflux transporter periplasmic adaptor subunit [Prolixibacteraceae bacterium]